MPATAIFTRRRTMAITVVAARGGRRHRAGLAASEGSETTASPTGAGSSTQPPAPSDVETVPPDRLARQVCRSVPREVLVRTVNGTHPVRSGDVQMITPFPDYVSWGLTHATPFDHTQGVPLLLYAPGRVKPGVYDEAVHLTDVSQTAASLLEFDGFTAPDGRALDEALLPPDQRTPPKLLVTMVWDSAGVDLLDRWPQSWPYLRDLAKRRRMVHRREPELGAREHPAEPRHDRHGGLPAPSRDRRRVHLDQRLAAEAQRRGPDLPDAADARRRLRPGDGQRADRRRRPQACRPT